MKAANVFVSLSILILVLGISGCNLGQKAPGTVSVNVQAQQDVGWNLNYYDLDFGNVSRCTVVDSVLFPHALEIINNGTTPVNVKVKYTTPLLSDVNSEWKYNATCKAINPISGNTYTFAGSCWDGATGLQETWLDLNIADTNVVTCLNYRGVDATTKPGVRVDNLLNVSCEEALGAKMGVVAFTFETATIATDCGGDSGYDPGG